MSQENTEPIHRSAADYYNTARRAPASIARWSRVVAWAGGLLALLIAVALFSRFGIDDTLRRDEAIYAYGGQQLAKGVPVYVSIFDPKTPLSAMLAAVGPLIAHPLGAGGVHLMRIEFFIFACLTVVAVYLLALGLWGSPLAGIVCAVTFASFKGFALDALGGPDAKTPGIFFAVVSMVLLVRRRPFWGAFAGSLAFLVWQPLGVYAVIAVLGTLLIPEADRRWRRAGNALCGAAIPVAAMTLYFWLAGALPQLVEAAVRFPLTGVQRVHETFAEHFDRIVSTVNDSYGETRVLFWGGLLLLLAMLVGRLVRGRADLRSLLGDPYLSVVIASFVPLAAFSLVDFQGYPDLYPLLPYAALGVGGAAYLAVRALRGWPLRGTATAVTLAAAAAIAGLSWHWYAGQRDTVLVSQRADAATIERMLGPRGTLYALGDPTPLVLTGRRNPSRFIYLGSGVARWVVRHTPGGLNGWKAKIRAAHPKVVVSGDWGGPYRRALETWLSSTYRAGHLGSWRIFVRPGRRARQAG
jgi:hypothetical protein